MKTKLRSLVTVVAAIAMIVAVPIAAAAWPAQTTGSLNVRSGPGVSYQKVGVLPAHAVVNVRYCQGSWCAIDYGPYGAWVSGSYLTKSYATPFVPPSPYYRPYVRPPLFGPWPTPYPQPGVTFQFSFGN